MRPPPPPNELPRYPVVGGLALLAIAVSLASWGKWIDISPLETNALLRHGQLWRLVTPVLPHGNTLHLVFNVYWLWVFGTLVEEEFGHLKTLAVVLLFALGSCTAEYALMHGGVGLSGVNYGLFGLLWALSRYDARFRGAVDPNTVVVMVAWFFICIALTYTGAMPVANVAHGVGALLGGALGVAIARPRLRGLCATGLALFLAASTAAALYGRQYVNFTTDRAEELARLGVEDLLAGRNDRGLLRLRGAVRIAPDFAGAWYNLGVACQRADLDDEAERAFNRAADLEPTNHMYREAAGRVPHGTE